MPRIISLLPTQPTAPPDPEWVEGSLVFRMPWGGVHVADGWRYGELFVHAGLPSDLDYVVVTHVASKVAITRVQEVEDAITIAEILWRECRGAWRCFDEVDKTKISQRMVDWIRECNKQRKLVTVLAA